jgi:hypothetical protein
MDVELKNTLNIELLPHQIQGLEWMQQKEQDDTRGGNEMILTI